MTQKSHTWNFQTIGGVKRVYLNSGNDLLHLNELDQKLWTALSCPVKGLEIDSDTLKLIDSDNDGQIRVPDILQAVSWICSILKDPNELLKQEAIFPLSAINDTTEEGKALLSSAKIILKNLGKPDATTLTVEETSNTEAIFHESRYNGDGIITEDTVKEEHLKVILNEIILTSGSLTDRGGKQGIDSGIYNTFIENCTKYLNWQTKKEINTNAILPFGEHTENAYQSFLAIKSKIDDFFIRCRLAAFDPQSTEVLNLLVARVETIASKDLSTCLDEIASYPLAKIETNKTLPITTGINPAWETSMLQFKQLICDVIYPNKQSITETEWQHISQLFNNYIVWISEKVGTEVEQLGIERIKEIVNGTEKESLVEYINKDMLLATEANSIISVDKLVRLHRDLFKLLKNFVTFYDFYAPEYKSIFQAGTLYIDQRSCDLCIKVIDMPKHNTMASFSGMFLLYCDCVSRSTNEKMTIVAALTNGDIDNLMVGRNALFYDKQGLDWDATVVKIIDNPISIKQAFWSPYRKVSRFIEAQINKVAAAQESKVTENATKSIEEVPVTTDVPSEPKTPAQPFDVGKFVGIFAAIGLAIGAIGSVLASIVSGFLGLVWWKMPLAFLGILLFISGPSMIIAYLKLRKRNLAPLLDANGWAINANIIVNIPFGNTLTHLASLPIGARINLNDPFHKKNTYLPYLLFVCILIGAGLFLLWKYKYLNF